MPRLHALLLVCLLIFGSCNSVRRNKQLLLKGDYDEAISLAIKKIQADRNIATTDEHKLLLAKAFENAMEQDLRTIRRLQGRNDLKSVKTIYYTYVRMDYRQEQVRPLLPIQLKESDQPVAFDLRVLGPDLLKAEQDYADVLALTARDYLNRSSKKDARYAYDLLCELYDLRPDDNEVARMVDEARFRGTDFVLIRVINSSGQIIPGALQRQLMDYHTYGLDRFWTIYHDRRLVGTAYDYSIDLEFRQILFSPEQILEREERRSRRLSEDENYARDPDGNILKDRNGKPIREQGETMVSAILLITEQLKTVQLRGQVIYTDLRNGRRLRNFPISNEFVFNNLFARYTGDPRALSPEDIQLTQNRFTPFPTNAQMLLTAGDELKLQLTEIIKRI